MSTHSLDASGSRPLTITTNDPARTAATVSAKQGENATITLGAFAWVEIPIPQTAGAVEVIVRKRATRVMKRDSQGDPVRDVDRNIVYEDGFEESRVLRLKGAFTASGFHDPDSQYANTPHTTLRVSNFENDPYKPLWIQGEIVSQEQIDLGFGIE